MALETGMKFIKYLLFIFNLLFAISGIALLITGGVAQGLYKDYINFLDDKFLSAPVLLMVVGAVIFIVGFFGCCGAVKENHCMVLTFSILLGIIFVVELAAGIAAYVLRDDIRNIAREKMQDGMQNYGQEGNGGVTTTWDSVQHDLHCCGTAGYLGWNSTPTSPDIPDSCCKVYKDGCGKHFFSVQAPNTGIIYTRGCLDAFEQVITDKIAIVGGVGVGIAFIQVIGIIFACCLARSIKQQYETV